MAVTLWMLRSNPAATCSTEATTELMLLHWNVPVVLPPEWASYHGDSDNFVRQSFGKYWSCSAVKFFQICS